MKYSADIQAQIRSGRGNFIAMCTSYVLGVFNDNYFKEAAILLAFAAGLNELQGPIIKYFSLPFILFSAYSGFFADRFPRRRVVIVAKYIEMGAMTLGAVGIALGSFPLIIAMVFCMALQSTLFGPALNGAIPELYPEVYVPKANALIKKGRTIGTANFLDFTGIYIAGALFTALNPRFSVTEQLLFVGGFAVVVAALFFGMLREERIHA